MGKWSNRSVDDIETEIMMETQSRVSSKDATREKDSKSKEVEETFRHEGKKY